MKDNMMKKWLTAFLQDEEGAAGIEYALIAMMVAVVLITLVPDISARVVIIFGQILAALGG
jgi:Flp pilus assembly pilin Flp